MVSRLLSIFVAASVILAGFAVADTPAAFAPFGHLQLTGDSRGFWLFDKETGNIYRYDVVGGRTKRRFVGAVTDAGQPLNSTPATYNPAETPRAQRRALATSCLEELRQLTGAVDTWAIENNKPAGAQPTIADLVPYLHRASRLRYWMEQGKCQDSLGNPITIPAVDGLPVLSRATYDFCSSVVPEDFWIPFPIGQ